MKGKLIIITFHTGKIEVYPINTQQEQARALQVLIYNHEYISSIDEGVFGDDFLVIENGGNKNG